MKASWLNQKVGWRLWKRNRPQLFSLFSHHFLQNSGLEVNFQTVEVDFYGLEVDFYYLEVKFHGIEVDF